MSNLPTKLELLQTDLVEIDHQHKKVTTNTLQVAEYFNKRPSEINRRITALGKKGLCKIAPSYYHDRQGKKQKYYELNRDQFLLLVLGFTGHKAERFKADFIRLFNQQEKELSHWRKQALLTTDSTKQANYQLYRLQKALIGVIPTSKKCPLLFTHVQQAITKAATGSAKTSRKTMTTQELDLVEQLERMVEQEIERLMNQGVSPEQVRDEVIAMIKKVGKKEAQTNSDQTNRKGFFNSISTINPTGELRQSSILN